MDLSGTSIGQYRILRLLGVGGMAEVYEAYEQALNRSIAIKVLLPQYAGDPVVVERFLQEGRAMARMGHPNIVPVYDVGVANGRYYLVMQRLEGEDLGTLLQRVRRLPPAQACSIAAQIGSALDHAHHHGTIHRDVKPSNIFVAPPWHATLSDFGIAKVLENPALSQSGQLIGTPFYMSPEQALARPAVAASDVYSLGVVLYEMLTGQRPFNAPSAAALAAQHAYQACPPVRAAAPELPAAIEPVMARALAKDARERFQTGQELSAALKRVFGAFEVSATEASGSALTQNQNRSRTQGQSLPGQTTQAPGPAAKSSSQPGLLSEASAGRAPRTPTPRPAATSSLQRKDRSPLLLAVAPAVAIILVVAVIFASRGGPGSEPSAGPPTAQGTGVASKRMISPTPSAGPGTGALVPGRYRVNRSATADISPHGTYTLGVPEVVVRTDGKLTVYVTWLWMPAPNEDPATVITKPSDTGNRNMYLTDETNTRYHHEEAGGAAGQRVDLPRGETVRGYFIFPDPFAGAREFQFHDDDRQIVITGIRLRP